VYQVEVTSDETLAKVLPDILAATARATLAHQEAPAGELTILITDDEVMAALNQAHRGVPASTDVLSFPAGDGPTIPDRLCYFGDIAISLPRAQDQAAAGGHTLEAELQLLVIHGTLHLLGHDHAEADEKARMWAAQGEVLRGAGSGERGAGNG